MHALSIDGALARRRPAAAGEATPVLWVHGLGESSRCFEDVLGQPELARREHWLVDLPGYGRAPWPDAPDALERAVDRLERVVAAIEAPAVVLAGHSLGGVLAIWLAERIGDRAAGVLDIDGNVTADDCTFSALAIGAGEEEFVARRFPEMLDRVYRGGLEERALRGYHASLMFTDPRTFYRQARDLVALSQDGALAERLARLSVPVLYLAGVPGGASATSLARLLELGVDVAEVGPAGHWPFVDRPEPFARAAAAFFARCDERRRA